MLRWSSCSCLDGKNARPAVIGLLGWMALVVAGATAAPGAEFKLSEDDLQRITAALPDHAAVRPAKARKVLLFGRTEGFNHAGGVAGGNKAIELMGRKTGAFSTEASTEMAMFEPETLARFDAVVFNNTTALKFSDPKHRKALLDFVHGGKGMIGVHSATDNFYNWPEGAAMMGALFAGHPWGRCAVRLDDPNHPLLRTFGGKGFWFSDEMYKMREPYSRQKLRVLLSFDLDKMTAKDAEVGRADRDNPIAWIQEVGKGRSFYCSFGHDQRAFFHQPINQFFLDGIQYAIGDLKADATPSAKLNPPPTAAPAPEKPQK